MIYIKYEVIRKLTQTSINKTNLLRFYNVKPYIGTMVHNYISL